MQFTASTTSVVPTNRQRGERCAPLFRCDTGRLQVREFIRGVVESLEALRPSPQLVTSASALHRLAEHTG